MFYLFHGEPPFEGMPPLEAAKAAALKMLRPVLATRLSPKLRALIAACWHPEPAERPSARGVCEVLEGLFPDANSDLSAAEITGEGCKCAVA